MKVDPIKLALLCQSIYAEKPPAGFEQNWNFAGTVAALARVDGCRVVVFRGSLTLLDWLRDAEAAPLLDYQLGFVHAGFMVGVRDVMVALSLIGNADGPLVITGHSLGGARARLLAALLVVNGVKVAQCTVFGSPRPAFANVRRVLEKSGVALASYRNRNDPVPIVPTILPWWSHTDEWITLDSPSDPNDLSPFRDHGSVRYIDGLQRLARGDAPNPAHNAVDATIADRLVFGALPAAA